MSKLIPLTQGQHVIVDDADYEWLSQWKWCFDGLYAATRMNGKKVRMHRLIMNAPPDLDVDHRDLNKLNCQRSNMRLTTRGGNLCNQPKRSDARTSKYKGVFLNKSGRWIAQVQFRGRVYKKESFASEVEAARYRDTLAKHYHGEFAQLNFPDEVEVQP